MSSLYQSGSEIEVEKDSQEFTERTEKRHVENIGDGRESCRKIWSWEVKTDLNNGKVILRWTGYVC